MMGLQNKHTLAPAHLGPFFIYTAKEKGPLSGGLRESEAYRVRNVIPQAQECAPTATKSQPNRAWGSGLLSFSERSDDLRHKHKNETDD